MPSTLFISAVILKTYKRCAKNLRLFTCGVFVLFFIFPLFCSLATAHAQATSTRDVTPPSTPTNFKVVEASTTEIDLSWDAATDNIGVAGYAILRDSTPPPISGIVGTTYADTGLLPATTYTYVIAAYDSAGNVSAWSEPVSATTMAVSVKFSKNDRVQTTESLNVRSTPSLSGTIVTSEASGTLGHIMGGPVAADGYAWWQVIYDDGISGWSVEDYLVKITESVTATSTYVAFSMGDRVRTTTNLNVRSDPSLSSTIGWVEA